MTPQPNKASDCLRQADLAGLLGEHCRRVGARAGAALRVGEDGRVVILAVWPEQRAKADAPEWLTAAVSAAGEVAASGRPRVQPLHRPGRMYDDAPAGRLAMVPFRHARAAGVAAFVADGADADGLAERAAAVRFEVDALSLYAAHLSDGPLRLGASEMAAAMAVVSAVNDHSRLLAAGMAFCNELAGRWRCDRVSLGFVAGRYVRLRATSHTEKISRRMEAVGRIEAAMEECLDQDLEVVFPAGEEAEFVWRSAAELSRESGGGCVLSVPLRRNGRVAAVMTAERPAGEPFGLPDAEGLRLTCDLCTARLTELHERDRWVGARLAASARAALAALIGPRHTWAKAAVAGVLIAAAVLAFARGDYQVRAPFVLEAARQQVAAAPFDGLIESVDVEVADPVEAGDVLARMRSTDLSRELNRLEAERFEADSQARAARAAGNWSQVRIAEAQGRQLDAKVLRCREMIETAAVRARMAGTVVRIEVEHREGAAVSKGQPLVEVARIDTLRAELSVPADQVAELAAAMAAGELRGELATTSYVDRKIPFLVRRIEPEAVEADGERVFKVRAELVRTAGDDLGWMRPRMAGVARITLDRRRYVWIWTRRLSNWLRLRLWA